ncbi:MAG: transposase [Verrucomicrobiota bacterium]
MSGEPDPLELLSVMELVALLQRVDALEADNATFKEQLRATKRATAPFSRGPGRATPKKSGRHAGKGRFERRAEPVAGAAGVVEDPRAPLDSRDCPQCGAPLEVVEQAATVEDTPPEPVRIIRRFCVEQGLRPVRGWRGRGRHADLPAGQHRATAHRTGPQVMARALTPHYHSGLPLCKVPAVIQAATGISLSQSALTQAAAALCAPGAVMDTTYQELREALRTSPVVNTDDTGWRIGGAGAFLMGFFTPLPTVFQIRWRHRHEEVVEMLSACFAGLPGADRGSSCEAGALDAIQQQKCLSHLLKNLSVVEETRSGRARAFTRELKVTLREAIKLWQDCRSQACTPEQYRERGQAIRQKLDRQLRDRRLKDPGNQRLLDGIGRQHDNGRVLLFLEHPEIEPANNRAGRGLRGAVIARKVSHCSKNERGARTCEVMKSITATLALRGATRSPAPSPT